MNWDIDKLIDILESLENLSLNRTIVSSLPELTDAQKEHDIKEIEQDIQDTIQEFYQELGLQEFSHHLMLRIPTDLRDKDLQPYSYECQNQDFALAKYNLDVELDEFFSLKYMEVE